MQQIRSHSTERGSSISRVFKCFSACMMGKPNKKNKRGAGKGSQSSSGTKKSDATGTKAQPTDVGPHGTQKSDVADVGSEPPQPTPQPTEEGDKKCLNVLLIGPHDICSSLCDLLKQCGQSRSMADSTRKKHDEEDTIELYFETDTTKCHLLKAQSHPKYVPYLIRKGLEVHIAMVMLPSLHSFMKGDQTATMKHHARFLYTLGISKVVLLLNTEAIGSDDFVTNLSARMVKEANTLLAQFNINVVSLVVLVVEPPLNIDSASNEGNPYLFGVLNSIEERLLSRKKIVRSNEEQSKWVEELALVDCSLDDDRSNPALWYKRAKILRNLQFFTDALYACKAALDNGFDISKKEDDALFYKMEGDHYFLNKEFGLAHEKYLQAKSSLKEQISQGCDDGQQALTLLQALIHNSFYHKQVEEAAPAKPKPKKDRLYWNLLYSST